MDIRSKGKRLARMQEDGRIRPTIAFSWQDVLAKKPHVVIGKCWSILEPLVREKKNWPEKWDAFEKFGKKATKILQKRKLIGDTMKTNELSTCFCTNDVDACREFYKQHFSAEAIFNCGWYVNLRIDGGGPTIQFMQPQEGMPTFGGTGVMLNFKVNDVDAEYTRLTKDGLQPAMPLEDHPWGDRGFSIINPIGNSVYIYSDREPSEKFKQYYKG